MGMRDPGRYENFMNLISRRTFRKALGYDVPGGSTGGVGFPAIYAISVVVPAESMALSRTLAANDHETYTELIYQPDILDQTAASVNDTIWNPNDLEAAYHRALRGLGPSCSRPPQTLSARRLLQIRRSAARDPTRHRSAIWRSASSPTPDAEIAKTRSSKPS